MATIVDRTPPSTTAAEIPYDDASTPVARPPIGVEPAKTVVNTLMTRPRRWSGTVSWIVVLALAAIMIIPAPTPNMHTTDSGYHVLSPKAVNRTARSSV